MKKILNCISIVMFFAVTAMVGISALFFQQKVGIKEIYEETSSPIQTAEEYVCENFPLQQNWNSLYSRCAEFMGKRLFGDIYFDRENDRLIRVFSDYDETQTEQNISAINVFKKQHSNLPIYVMIVPTASGIYKEDLPDSAGALDQQQLIDDIYYELDAEITPLDVYAALYSSRDDYVYFRTAPYWTQLGAYQAYSAVISKLGFQPYTIANYDIDFTHVSYVGKLSEESGMRTENTDTINAFRCKHGSYIKSTTLMRDKQTYTKTSVYSRPSLQSDNKYEYFLGSDSFKCAQIQTTNEDSPSLLIIKSDYANCFVPLLAPHYSKITLIDLDMLGEDETLEDVADPDDYDQVLFLCDAETFCESKGFEKLKSAS